MFDNIENNDIKIIDTTLRDGEQTSGVTFFKKDKVKIAKELDKLGVEIIEAGIPIVGKHEIEILQTLNNMKFNSKLLTWNRLKKEDILASLKTGIKNIHISVPVSDIHIYKKLKKDRRWILSETQKMIEFAASYNLNISIGAEDASRTDENFLIEFYKLVEKLGVKRVRYADTLSTLNPITTNKIITKLKNEISCDIDFHGHNDFGMATANAFVAYKSGAKYISTCVNGIGERAGNTALEEILLSLKYLDNEKDNYKLNRLYKLSKIVEKSSKIKIAENKPIVGERVFSHESGIHVDGLLKAKEIYQFLNPDDINRKNKIVLGKFSGKSALRYLLNSSNINKYNSLFNNLAKELS
jgi:homocitrate synthase NifV